jgi:hypothetical protein
VKTEKSRWAASIYLYFSPAKSRISDYGIQFSDFPLNAVTIRDFEMSFGYSVGDFLSVAATCWQVYKKCKDSSGEFKDMAVEVSCLHSVLKETEEVLSEENLSDQQQARLKPLKDGVLDVLKELERRLKKYESLGTQSRRALDRMGWAREGGVVELRQKLISQTTLLDAFNNR